MKKILGVLALGVVMAAVLVFLSWARRVFVTGLNPFLWYAFVGVILLLGIPLIIKGGRWVRNKWEVDARYMPAVLFAAGCLSWLIVWLCYGVPVSSTVDIQLHDTLYVIAHWHVMSFLVIFLGVVAGIYYIFSKAFVSGALRAIGYFHFWVTFVACYLIMRPGSYYLSPADMPRRYMDYGGNVPVHMGISLTDVELLVALAMQGVFVGVVVYGVGKLFFRRQLN